MIRIRLKQRLIVFTLWVLNLPFLVLAVLPITLMFYGCGPSLESKDSRERVKAVNRLTDESLLEKIALYRDTDMHLAAMRRLKNQKFLMDMAIDRTVPIVYRMDALLNIKDQTLLAEVALKGGFRDSPPLESDIAYQAFQRLLNPDQQLLALLALESDSWEVGRLAFSKLENPNQELLVTLALKSHTIRTDAYERLRNPDQPTLAQIAITGRSEALKAITDQKMLAKVAIEAEDISVRVSAVKRIRDQDCLDEVAAKATDWTEGRAAFVKLVNPSQAACVNIAIIGDDGNALAAFKRLLNPTTELLENIALLANNKFVALAAFNKLSAIDPAIRAKIASRARTVPVTYIAIGDVNDRNVLKMLSRDYVDGQSNWVRQQVSQLLLFLTDPRVVEQIGKTKVRVNWTPLSKDYQISMSSISQDVGRIAHQQGERIQILISGKNLSLQRSWETYFDKNINFIGMVHAKVDLTDLAGDLLTRFPLEMMGLFAETDQPTLIRLAAIRTFKDRDYLAKIADGDADFRVRAGAQELLNALK